MAKLKDLIKQCGTVQVKTAPLLMLIGASLSKEHGPDVETIVEMLDPEDDDDDDW